MNNYITKQPEDVSPLEYYTEFKTELNFILTILCQYKKNQI